MRSNAQLSEPSNLPEYLRISRMVNLNEFADANISGSNMLITDFKLIPPPNRLDSLPAKYKWEVMRRHPLYIWMWDMLQALKASGPHSLEEAFSSHPQVSTVGELIGVNGIPVSPALEFDALVDAETNPLWLKRAARPVTLRYIARLLLGTNLQPETLRLLAEHFSRAADTANSDNKYESLSNLTSVVCPELDLLPGVPLYLLFPAAPAEEFSSDLKKLRNEWRERFKLPESRASETKYRSYLRAWDLREGWSGGKYHRDAVHSMKDVANALGKKKSSARNWYQSGFKLVTGHDFSVEAWAAVMGVTQLSELMGETVDPVSGRRATRSSSRRPVDDTTVSGGQNHQGTPGVVESLAAQLDSRDVEQMVKRIVHLIAKGRSNKEIRDDLDLDETVEPAIEKIRETREI